MPLDVNRRTFIKKISNFALMSPLLTLLPFGKSEAKVNIPEIKVWDDLSVPIKRFGYTYLLKYDPWFYYNGKDNWQELHRSLKNITAEPTLIVSEIGNDFIKRPLTAPQKYYDINLEILKIDNILFCGIPVMGIDDVQKMNKLNLLGKRVYAT